MRHLAILVFLLMNLLAFGQISENLVVENIFKIEKALIQKDTVILQDLLHPKLTFGHSNGWIETKESLFSDLKKSKVSYTKFEKASEVVFVEVSQNHIITRRDINAFGMVDTHDFSVKLNILEIWTFQNGNWKLLARQSVNRRE